MLYLGAGRGVKNGEAGVDMPFIGVDAECDVDFYVFNTGGIPGDFPGKLTVSMPCCAHAERCMLVRASRGGVRYTEPEKGCMGDSLGVCSNSIVLGSTEVDYFGAEAGQYLFNQVVRFLGGPVLDKDLHEDGCFGISPRLPMPNTFRLGLLTNGCPLGSMLGPCKLWQLTISTSCGRCFSNAAISGALHDVCPPTIAPSFVATISVSK